MLILIDGCEKAGKTTLCNKLVERYNARYRHWGPIQSDTEFLVGLQEDVVLLQKEPSQLVVWDRGWPADAVYSKLLHRDHRFGRDPWLAEWLYGRAVASLGGEVILAGPPPDVLAAKRDETDLPVDPAEEQATYATYAQIFGLPLLRSTHGGDDEVTAMADKLITTLGSRMSGERPARLPRITGSLRNHVFVVNDYPTGLESSPEGGWLVGTSAAVTDLARSYGIASLSAGWVDVHHASTVVSQLLRCRHVHAVGTDAYTYLREMGIDHAALT